MTADRVAEAAEVAGERGRRRYRTTVSRQDNGRCRGTAAAIVLNGEQNAKRSSGR